MSHLDPDKHYMDHRDQGVRLKKKKGPPPNQTANQVMLFARDVWDYLLDTPSGRRTLKQAEGNISVVEPVTKTVVHFSGYDYYCGTSKRYLSTFVLINGLRFQEQELREELFEASETLRKLPEW